MHNLLTTSTDLLRVITGSAADVDCIVSFIEYTTAGPPVLDAMDTQFTNITTATTTTVLGAPTSGSDRRRVKAASFVNTHATVSTTLRVIIERTGPVNWDLFNTVNLAPGESLTFTEGTGWFHNKAGNSAPVYNQSTADQVTAATDVYLTGSNLLISGRCKIGTRLEWVLVASKTAASTATPTITIRFGTAGAIGDTARCTHVGPAQTAVVDEGVLRVFALVRGPISASCIVQSSVDTAHRAAAAAGFGEFCDETESTGFDITAAGTQAGLSFNGSTAAAWTFHAVEAEAHNLVG